MERYECFVLNCWGMVIKIVLYGRDTGLNQVRIHVFEIYNRQKICRDKYHGDLEINDGSCIYAGNAMVTTLIVLPK